MNYFKLIARLVGYSDEVIEHGIFSQAILETGHFKSDSYLYGHNLFGMKKAKIRDNTQLKSTYLGHATYRNDIDSFIDLLLRHQNFNITPKEKTNLDAYFSFLLATGYAEDENYIIKLQNLNK